MESSESGQTDWRAALLCSHGEEEQKICVVVLFFCDLKLRIKAAVL